MALLSTDGVESACRTGHLACHAEEGARLGSHERPNRERRAFAVEGCSRVLVRLLLAFAVSLSLLMGGSSRGAEASREYLVKGGYLLNFSKFVDWPAGAFAVSNAPLVIGIAGNNPFGGDLEAMVAGHTAFGHPLVVRQFAADDAALSTCHIVFVSKGRDEKSVLRLVCDSPVLTVGESDAFLKSGGMIQFCLEGGKVRFDINTAATRKAGLQVRAQLLKIAREVHGKGATE